MTIRLLSMVFLFAVGMSLVRANAAVPFTLTLPPDFSGPKASSFAGDQNYSFVRPSAESTYRCLLEITIGAIPESEMSDPLQTRLDRLLKGIEGRRKAFIQGTYVTCTLSGLSAISVDWEGEFKGRRVKGRAFCAVYRRNLIRLVMEDSLDDWAERLPDLEKALTTFKLL